MGREFWDFITVFVEIFRAVFATMYVVGMRCGGTSKGRGWEMNGTGWCSRDGNWLIHWPT